MAESDVFERRLRMALVRHVDGGPTDFDAISFAQAVAAKEPRRHGLGVVLGWRGFAIPRLAWALLLLGLLLVAMVGGALIVGSQPVRKLAAMPPAFVCPPGSTPDEPGPVDQARPEDPRTAAFDRRAGRLVVLADIFPGGGIKGVETWTFDVCSNTWTQMHPDQQPPTSGYQLVYDVDSDVTILISWGQVWVYDLQADSWTQKAGPQTGATLWAYDPRSGLVVAAHDDAEMDVLGYAVETDTWTPTPIHQTNPPAASGPRSLTYDASVDRIIAYDWAGLGMSLTSLFDIRTGTWSSSGVQTPFVIAGFGMSVPVTEYDEAAARTVVFGNDRMALYDATADRWETLDATSIEPPDGWPDSMVYDSVNERLIGCKWLPLYERKVDVIALDLVTREWTVLLEKQ